MLFLTAAATSLLARSDTDSFADRTFERPSISMVFLKVFAVFVRSSAKCHAVLLYASMSIPSLCCGEMRLQWSVQVTNDRYRVGLWNICKLTPFYADV